MTGKDRPFAELQRQSLVNARAQAAGTQGQAGGSFVPSFGENTFRLKVHRGGNIGSNPLPASDPFPWGGLLRPSGCATGQRVGGPLIPGNPSGRLNSIGLFVGMDTLIGPVYRGDGLAEDHTPGFYFFLGTPR